MKDRFDITGQVEEAKKKAQRIYPCRSNRASSLGHPCTRYLVYMRTASEKKTLPSIDLEFIFEGGRFIEELAINQLKQAGYEISNQQRDFEDRKYGITGHVDGMIRIEGELYPIEIKGISPFEWVKIDAIEDMTLSKRVWTRGYPAQLQLYLFLSNKQRGLFYILNKLTYRPKAIWMEIDYTFCEELIKKAERINKHLKDDTLPERTLDFDVCMKCDFKALCLPDLKNTEGIEFIDSQELECKLDRRGELKPLAKEYKKIDDEVSTVVKGKKNLLVGDWMISGKEITVTRKATEESKTVQWRKSIVRIGEGKK